ncbi:hypothetical protein OPV22_007857 [Ensete ventricosum]|uniref:Uncharacterized protein n=1 Tax=Ensete ventricosum TaxID=4639 RepID=A0AAV8PN02_ENSVE|nr:hypothetical protein OPV22_007857 [Ensete ventricosum]
MKNRRLDFGQQQNLFFSQFLLLLSMIDMWVYLIDVASLLFRCCFDSATGIIVETVAIQRYKVSVMISGALSSRWSVYALLYYMLLGEVDCVAFLYY